MTTLLDTHFVLWIVTNSKRLRAFPWLEQHQPWGVSPVSLLEIQYLAEIGRAEVDSPALAEIMHRDKRFVVDDTSLLAVVRRALPLTWTRDPFDRLLAAHSLARRIPLCTVDRIILEHHGLVLPE